MKDKDYNQIAAIEKAIAEKYGGETVQNPKANWDEEKEKEYLQQMKEFYDKNQKNSATQDKINVNGIKVSKKLLNRESLKTCSVCNSLSRKAKDDVYLMKFECCWKCFERYVDGREERWLKGWRPNN